MPVLARQSSFQMDDDGDLHEQILHHAVRSPPANTREGSERGADGLVSCRDRSLGGAISFGRDLCGRSIVHAVIIDRR